MTKSTLIDIIILLFIGLISITWFQDKFIIDGGDLDYPLRPQTTISRYFHLWDEKTPPGTPLSRHIPQLLPYQFGVAFLSYIGVSIQNTQKIIFFIIFFGSGLSMYFLVKTLMGQNFNRIHGITSALFFMMNPCMRTFFWRQFHINFNPFLPLFIAYFIKYIDGNSFKPLFTFLILSIFISTIFTNPATVIVFWFVPALYVIYQLLITGFEYKILKKNVLKFSLCLGLWIGLHSWWGIPLMSFFQQEFKASSQTIIGKSDTNVLDVSSRDTSFYNLFRLYGHWAIQADAYGDQYYGWSKIYQKWSFHVLSLFPIILIFWGLVSSRTNDKNTIFFILLIIITLIISKGSHDPFGKIQSWLYTKIKILGAFRSPYEKFYIVLIMAYAFLIGKGLTEFIEKMKSKGRFVGTTSLISILIILFVINEWPFWTGKVIFDGGKILPGFHTKIPDSYDEANDWLKNQKPEYSRIFTFPLITVWGMAYDWPSGYGGVDPTWHLLDYPIIRGPGMDIIYREIYKNIEKKNTSELVYYLRIYNTKYVLVHRDIKFGHPTVMSSPNLEKPEKVTGITFSKSFHDIDFYRLNEKLYLPLVYTAPALHKVVNIIDGAKERIPCFIYKDDNNFSIPEGAYNETEQSSHILKLERHSPTRLSLHIRAEKPFWLIFLESFNPGWQLSLVNHEQNNRSYSHIKINGYANGWWITETGDLDVNIQFKPQSLLFYSSFISLIFLIMVVFMRARMK